MFYVSVNVSNEYRLVGMLLENYERTARPRYNSSDVVEIMVRFSLQQIYDLVSKKFTFFTATGKITDI